MISFMKVSLKANLWRDFVYSLNELETKRSVPGWVWATNLFVAILFFRLVPYGLAVRIPGYHPYGMGISIFDFASGLELIEVVFLLNWQLTRYWFSLDRGLKLDYYSGKERGIACRGKIYAQFNLWQVVDFPSDIFLIQSSLGKALMCCTCIFYRLSYT